MRTGLILALFFAIALSDAVASANVLEQRPIEQQFAEADLVIIGRIGARQQCLVRGVRMACAEIISNVILKGAAAQAGAPRLLVLEASYSEFGIDDMELRGTLIIFMKRYRDETYIPIIGRNSVFLISPGR
jgi:hypothetical protein